MKNKYPAAKADAEKIRMISADGSTSRRVNSRQPIARQIRIGETIEKKSMKRSPRKKQKTTVAKSAIPEGQEITPQIPMSEPIPPAGPAVDRAPRLSKLMAWFSRSKSEEVGVPNMPWCQPEVNSRNKSRRKPKAQKPISHLKCFSTPEGEMLLKKIPRWVPSSSTLLAHTLTHLRTYQSVFIPRNYDEPSPQRWILDSLEGKDRAEKLKQFEKAKSVSQWICFDLSAQMWFGKDWFKNPSSMADKYFLKMAVIATLNGTTVPSWDGREQNPEFVERVSKELRNWRERRHKLRFPGGDLITIACAWTSPFTPLWMMNNEAGSKMVGMLCGDLSKVQAANYAQIIKRAELPRFGGFPIMDANFGRNKMFTGYRFRADIAAVIKAL